VFLAIRDILLRDISHQRVSSITISKQGNDGEEYFGYGECRTPIVFEDIQTDGSLRIDIAMIDPRTEDNLGRFERVIRGKGDLQEEYSTLVHGSRGSEDGTNPIVDVVTLGPSTAVGGRIDGDLREFPLDPFNGGTFLLCGCLCLWFGTFGDVAGGVRGAGVRGGSFRGVGTQRVRSGTRGSRGNGG